jgi:anti-anti-sigma factor
MYASVSKLALPFPLAPSPSDVWLSEFASQDGTLRVRLQAQRLEAGMAPELRETIAQNVTGSPKRVILCLTGIRSIDSTVLAALLTIPKLMSPKGGFAIAGASGEVGELIKRTGLHKLFRFFENEAQAVAAFRPSGCSRKPMSRVLLSMVLRHSPSVRAPQFENCNSEWSNKGMSLAS